MWLAALLGPCHPLPMATAPYASRAPDTLTAAELAEAIQFHNAAYWRHNTPQIPDQVYDQLVERLRSLDPAHPVLDELGAGDTTDDGLTAGDKVVHAVPMLSLGKCYGEAELLHWARQYDGKLIASPKVDGAACSVRYDDSGAFVAAATRGDGVRGESIGHQVALIPNVPAQLPKALVDKWGGAVEVRGEVYLPLTAFDVVSELYANPRNVAAGALKAKEQGAVAATELRLFAYDLLGWETATEAEKVTVLREMGFDPAPAHPCTRDSAQHVYDKISAERGDYDYETDGVVYKMDDIAAQKRLGSTAHHPRWAIAYKFQGDSGDSELIEVQWSLARTGTITPVAIVKPVLLSGAMVSRATLHNLSNVERLALHVGDRLQLTRRGGVIPHVEGNLGGGKDEVAYPPFCPSCGKATEVHTSTRRVSGEDLVTRTLHCTVPAECPQTLRGQLFHYTRVLDIDGFGDKILKQLLSRGLVRDAAGLYALTPSDLNQLERLGPKLAVKLVDNVAARRSVPLARFLVALGIETLGKHAAKLLASKWTLAELRSREVADFSELPGLGQLTAEQIVAGLAAQSALIDRLSMHVTIEAPQQTVTSGVLDGQVVVFTGKLETMNRRDAQHLVVGLGGTAGSSVTKETTLVVVGGDGLTAAKPSSKIKKARKLAESGTGLMLLSEADFQQQYLSESAS
ncbi:MAG: NAD-dependent DNA ligase LigA [Myxococcales bacterium]|nr:NAD-dependent DNA ligase LigA [Myxococcales bacterium]